MEEGEGGEHCNAAFRADFLPPFVSLCCVLKNKGCCVELVVVSAFSSIILSDVLGLSVLFSELLAIWVLGVVNTFWKPFTVGNVLLIVEAIGNKASGAH